MEFHRLASRNDLNEIEEQLIARYVGGLLFVIQQKIPLHTISTLDDVVNMVDQVENAVEKTSRYASTLARAGGKEENSVN